MSEQRKYRSWTAQQKLEIVLAGLRGDRSVREVCREHGISETLFYGWRDQLLEAGRERFAGKEQRSGERELRRKIAELAPRPPRRTSGRSGRRRTSWRSRENLGGLGVSMRVARSRRLVAEGYALATVARVMQISRPVEAAIVAEALANQTDGYRMVCAFVRRRLGVAVNRKRVLRVMRERKLIQRRRPLERRKRPGFFRVERPRQLWQLDLTSIWVAEHGWTYLNAIIDCCTREIVAWQLELRCRADEAITVVERAAAVHGIELGELVLGSDNGSAFTARRFRGRLAELRIKHRRGGSATPSRRPSSRAGSGN